MKIHIKNTRMNRISISIFFFLFSIYTFGQVNQSKSIPAFPGAEGAGAFATGGRGGQIVYVTSLEDDKSIEGSLRWAVGQRSPKIIQFKVAGIIDLKAPLKISKGDVTIAGQSAPGDGICIKGYPFIIGADNVVIRYLRFRMGDENKVQDDALKANKVNNVIIDHCSMSWSTDECASFYDNENFTLQWCLIAESLRNSVHKKGSHGYGGIWGGQTVTFHHNLLAHHDSRNPRFCGSRYSNQPELEKVDFRNNVIYNWGQNSAYAGEGGTYDLVNNYYKPGPATLAKKGKVRYRILAPNDKAGKNTEDRVWGRFYVSGNFMFGHEDVTKNNSLGVHPDPTDSASVIPGDLLAKTEFKMPFVTTQKAEDAYNDVLKFAGASFKRDVVDTRIVNEVKNGTFTFKGSNGSDNGIIDSQSDVGGWPEYKCNSKDILKDSDEDGMPDVWEEKHKLNKNNKEDGYAFTLDKNYTNVEIYLNELCTKK